MLALAIYYIFLLLVWGLFRFVFNLPIVVEELWIKPVVWLMPVLVWNFLLRKKRIVMLGREGLLRSILFGLVVGLLYVLLFVGLGHSGSGWKSNIGVGMATAIVEEILFSGFLYGFFAKERFNKYTSLFLVAIMATLIHIPYFLFKVELKSFDLVGSLILVFSYSFVNSWIRMETGNVAGSIVARFLLILATS